MLTTTSAKFILSLLHSWGLLQALLLFTLEDYSVDCTAAATGTGRQDIGGHTKKFVKGTLFLYWNLLRSCYAEMCNSITKSGRKTILLGCIVYSVYETQLSNLWWMPNSVSMVWALPWERTHQDNSNDTPQHICEFQVGFPLLWIKAYPGLS